MGREERKEEVNPKSFAAQNRSLQLETMAYIKRIPYRKRWIYRDPAKEREINQRNHDIVESLGKGITLKELGEKYGITRQRVQQIAEKFDAPSSIEVRKRLKEQRLRAEEQQLRERPCFVCGKPARSTRIAKARKERLYCDKCRVLVTRESNIKSAMHVRAASLVLAAKKMGVCTLCRRKLLGSNAYRGIICTRHDMALKAGVHNARQAMRNHPELNWKRILGEAALCRKCEKRRASPGFATCSRCQKSEA